jgi:hypothetical protein
MGAAMGERAAYVRARLAMSEGGRLLFGKRHRRNP